MKALIVRLSSIGDVLHTLPALAALQRHGWEAGWLVEPAARPLLEGQSFLCKVFGAPGARDFRLGSASAVVTALREERYDVALDFQGLWKSAVWARLSGAQRFIGYSAPWRREPLSGVLITEPADLPLDLLHVIDKNLALLRLLGIDAVGLREFPLPATEAQSEAMEKALGDLGLKDYVILNPGGGWANKLWTADGYAGIGRGLRDRGIRSLVTWGPGEERLAERVVALSDGAALKCPTTTLLDFIELARRARLVVAADTGPLHIACAVRTPVVGIYGPTEPARNGPFSPRDVVVRRAPLCSPCHKRRCAIHEGVMQAITPAEVLRAIDRRLGLSSGSAALAV